MPVLFSIFINDIKAVNTNKNLLVKFADDITVSLPIEANVGLYESETEDLSFIEWSENNCMNINMTKIWELLLRGKTTRTPPEPLEIIGKKEKLKLLGVAFEQVPYETLGMFRWCVTDQVKWTNSQLALVKRIGRKKAFVLQLYRSYPGTLGSFKRRGYLEVRRQKSRDFFCPTNL